MSTKMPLLTITDAAASRIKSLVSNEELLRVGIKKGGCAGMEYAFDKVAAPAKFDEVVEDKGVKIVIDAKAVLYLIGAKMDWKEDKFSSAFTFINPNEASACGCGESVNLVPSKAM